MVNLEVLNLRKGRVVKPLHECGTCGWYPKAWTIAYVSKGENPISAFLKYNSNWKISDISEVV